MKLALVLMTLTRTVLLERVKARVKRPHMTPLNARFITKKNCKHISYQVFQDIPFRWREAHSSDCVFHYRVLAVESKEFGDATCPCRCEFGCCEFCEDAVDCCAAAAGDGVD